MPRGYLKNPRVPIAEVAKKETAKRKKQQAPEIQTEMPQISTETPSESNYTPCAKKSNTGHLTHSSNDLLLNTQISAPTVKDAATEEGLTSTNAYASRRIEDLSTREIQAHTLQLSQIARQRKYSLDDLVHTPEQLQHALDDFNLTCLQLNLYPLQYLLAIWLNTTAAQILALSSARNVSEAGDILARQSDYSVAVISSTAMVSKNIAFQIYFLKATHRMYDAPLQNMQSGIIANANITNINISNSEISKKSEIFAEIDGEGSTVPDVPTLPNGKSSNS